MDFGGLDADVLIMQVNLNDIQYLARYSCNSCGCVDSVSDKRNIAL